eukprot:10463958-Alexandrium_andersonii.AAC.1
MQKPKDDDVEVIELGKYMEPLLQQGWVPPLQFRLVWYQLQARDHLLHGNASELAELFQEQ